MNRTDKIIGIGTLVGFLTLNGIGAYALNKAVESNGGKTIPGQFQPMLTVYDIDRDGEPDYTEVGIRGPFYGASTWITRRPPTQTEIDWYKSQKE